MDPISKFVEESKVLVVLSFGVDVALKDECNNQ